MRAYQKRGRQGQVAMEYLMISGIIAVALLPALYLFYNSAQKSSENVNLAQLDKMGKDIVSTAEKIYYQGPPSRTIIEARMPNGVRNISVWNILSKNAYVLIFNISNPGPTIQPYIYDSGVGIAGMFQGSYYNLTTTPGTKKISIEAYQTSAAGDGAFTFINFGGRCPRAITYDYDDNGQSDSSDLTFINRCYCNTNMGSENYPKFRPTKTWQEGWFDNTDATSENHYAACTNADFNGNCEIDDEDVGNFCSMTGLCAPPLSCPSP